MVSGETFALKAQLTDLLAMCGTSSGSIVPAFMALAYRIVWAEIKSATRVNHYLTDLKEVNRVTHLVRPSWAAQHVRSGAGVRAGAGFLLVA